MQPAPFGLLQSFLQNVNTDALDLHVHLGGCQPIGWTTYLTISGSPAPFADPRVGNHPPLPSPAHPPHRNPGCRFGDRRSSIPQRHVTAADAGHGGGPVGFGDIGTDPDHITKIFKFRNEPFKCSFCEITVSDLASSRPAHKADRKSVV